MLCTNKKIFSNILQLQNRKEGETPFEWNSIFTEDIKTQLYSLDIIESILKTNPDEGDEDEKVLRVSWITRFLLDGGFNFLLGQIERAISLSSEAISKNMEMGDLNKRYVAQVVKLLKTFIFAIVCAN